MTPKGFQVGEWDVRCDVCGTSYSVRFQNQIAGKSVCVMCNRYRHMVHALRYVEHMAAKECTEVLYKYNDGMQQCSLSCSCDTCGARKVLRFIERWHNARR